MCRSKCNFAYVGFVGVCYWVIHFVSFINQLLTQSFCKGKSFASLHEDLLSGLYVCVCYVWSRFVSCACLFFPLQIMIVSCLEEHWYFGYIHGDHISCADAQFSIRTYKNILFVIVMSVCAPAWRVHPSVFI